MPAGEINTYSCTSDCPYRSTESCLAKTHYVRGEAVHSELPDDGRCISPKDHPQYVAPRIRMAPRVRID